MEQQSWRERGDEEKEGDRDRHMEREIEREKQ